MAANAAGSASRHPKTGERRQVRRPLQLDCLPLAMLDRIRAERAAGRSWAEIEQSSPQWPEWEQAGPEALACFPHRRLPHSSLQRWHDLRVEQVRREQERQSLVARAIAAQLAAHGFSGLDAAVKNALGEAVFGLLAEGAGRDEVMKALHQLSRLLVSLDRAEIGRSRLELEKEKLELLARKRELPPRPVAGPKPEGGAGDEMLPGQSPIPMAKENGKEEGEEGKEEDRTCGTN
jgi:hypothetical protein